MKSLQVLGGIGALALAMSGCSTWDSMGHTEQGTTVGAGSGAVAGAVVGGPVGAVVGGVAGGVAGHEMAKDEDHGGYASREQDARASQSANAGSPPSAQASGGANTSYRSEMESASAAPRTSRAAMPAGKVNDPSFVRSVQQALNQQGYNAGPVDGIVGPRTSRALREFQDASGLQPTGQLDSSTVAALGVGQSNESSTTASKAARGTSASAGVNTASSGAASR